MSTGCLFSNTLRADGNYSPHANELIEAPAQIEGAARSAAAVVPRILDLFPWVRSVVDVGCGVGLWLHQFHLNGVQRLLGVDANEYPDSFLQIKPSEYQQRELSVPFTLQEQFDLALALNVGGHLEKSSAPGFVLSLTKASDLIIFSAPIPGQTSVPAPYERWPSYWAALFEKHGFLCFDVLRGDMWYDARVEWCYRQNIFVFVNKQRTDLVAKLEAVAAKHRPPIDLVHPLCFDVYRGTADLIEQGKVNEAAMSPLERTELAILRERLFTMEKSTSWQIISAIQRLIAPYPRLRKFIRRGLTAVRLMATGKFLSTLRERRRAAAGKI